MQLPVCADKREGTLNGRCSVIGAPSRMTVCRTAARRVPGRAGARVDGFAVTEDGAPLPGGPVPIGPALLSLQEDPHPGRRTLTPQDLAALAMGAALLDVLDAAQFALLGGRMPDLATLGPWPVPDPLINPLIDPLIDPALGALVAALHIRAMVTAALLGQDITLPSD